MSEPKRPGQGRSAVPEFTQTDFAVHDGSNAGRMDTDLSEMGNMQADGTPYAMERLISMLSDASGRRDAAAQPSVTPVQRRLFSKLIATFSDIESSDRASAAAAEGVAERRPANDERTRNVALQRRAAALREHAIALRDERAAGSSRRRRSGRRT